MKTLCIFLTLFCFLPLSLAQTSSTKSSKEQPLTEDELRQRLLLIPEVSLNKESAETSDSSRLARRELEKQAHAIKQKNKNGLDGFVRELQKERADLAGLPFVVGKGFLRESVAAGNLETCSQACRKWLQASLAGKPKSFYEHEWTVHPHSSPRARNFQDTLNSLVSMNNGWHEPFALSVLEENLMAENPSFRWVLVEHLEKTRSKESGTALARRALFDSNLNVRLAALDALRTRPAVDYSPIIVQGLKFPWAPAAAHAAEAIVNLKMNNLIPRLVDMLDEPDPGAFFTMNKKTVVRELVRIHHQKNCFLCHPPSFSPKDQVRSPVPLPPNPKLINIGLDPSGYREPSGVFIRADATFLKADFAAMLPVGKGRKMTYQRFDFVVRVRELADKEKQTMEAKLKKSDRLTDHRIAILFALKGLTGKEAGPTAKEWRKALAMEKK